MWPHKNISHIQVLVIYFSPTWPIKLKLGLQIGGRLLIATHLDQSNSLAHQKQGAVSKYNLTVFIRLCQGSCRALEAVHFSRVTAVFQWIHWIWLLHLIQDFQCRATYWALVEMLWQLDTSINGKWWTTSDIHYHSYNDIESITLHRPVVFDQNILFLCLNQ